MNPAKYFLLSLLSLLLAMFSISCDNGDGDDWDEDNVTEADAVRGGLLYDKWWKISGTEPTGDHPMWGSQTTNTRDGSDTWRCKECHGWDYAGKDGAYGSGSHYTGFMGLMGAFTEETEHVFEHFSETNHDFTSVLTDADLYDLTKFITTELIDVGAWIDLDTKAAFGDPTGGMARYESTDASTGGQCITCHGADGRTILFHDTDGVSDLANENPWEILHKIRFGHPGSSPAMPSTVAKGIADPDAVEILAYAQTGLALNGAGLIGTWVANESTGDLGNTGVGSGSLAGAGWVNYSMVMTMAGTFLIAGANLYDASGVITYSGTVTLDPGATLKEIDLTITESSNLVFFTTTDSLQPAQPGIFELNAAGDELTIQWGAKAFGVPRPTAFMVDANGDYDSGTLVKQ